MDNKYLSVFCEECGAMNNIPIRRLYDGYEGAFICENCNAVLTNVHEILDL